MLSAVGSDKFGRNPLSDGGQFLLCGRRYSRLVASDISGGAECRGGGGASAPACPFPGFTYVKSSAVSFFKRIRQSWPPLVRNRTIVFICPSLDSSSLDSPSRVSRLDDRHPLSQIHTSEWCLNPPLSSDLDLVLEPQRPITGHKAAEGSEGCPRAGPSRLQPLCRIWQPRCQIW